MKSTSTGGVRLTRSPCSPIPALAGRRCSGGERPVFKGIETDFRFKPAIGMRIIFAVLLLVQAAACGRGGDQVAIAGKTVYRGMAIEEVQLRVLRLDGGRWKECAAGRSGYHGSFVVRTDPGRVRLEASGEIIAGGKRFPLEGRVDMGEIPTDVRRIDRIVIELVQVNGGSGGRVPPSAP